MTTLSAGQLLEKGEINALLAATGQAITTFTATLALLTTAATGVLDPTNTTMAGASITEVSTGSAYARQAYGPTTPTSASPSVVKNTSTITFGPFTSAPGTITWGILCDSTSGTTAVIYGAFLLGTARTPLTGDSLQAAANAFTFTET